MIIIKSSLFLKKKIKIWKKENKKIAFIPTMGSLHEGHIKLINKSNSIEKVIVSIFVNPIQFDRSEDFLKYPKNIKKDCKLLLKNCKVDILFIPGVSVLYPSGFKNKTFIDVPMYSNILEGKVRPGYFCGVTTVIVKLFNLIQPNIVFFGEKDFQQLVIIRQLVKDLMYDIKIVGVPTIRDHQGLALSSRNNLLSVKGKEKAININKILKKTKKRLFKDNYKISFLLEKAKQELIKSGLEPHELLIFDSKNLGSVTCHSKEIIIFFSVWIEKIRLIDSLKVNLTNPIKKIS